MIAGPAAALRRGTGGPRGPAGFAEESLRQGWLLRAGGVVALRGSRSGRGHLQRPQTARTAVWGRNRKPKRGAFSIYSILFLFLSLSLLRGKKRGTFWFLVFRVQPPSTSREPGHMGRHSRTKSATITSTASPRSTIAFSSSISVLASSTALVSALVLTCRRHSLI